MSFPVRSGGVFREAVFGRRTRYAPRRVYAVLKAASQYPVLSAPLLVSILATQATPRVYVDVP